MSTQDSRTNPADVFSQARSCTVCGGKLEASEQYPDAGLLHADDANDTHAPVTESAPVPSAAETAPAKAPWCETCGSEVSPEGKCGCWAHLADALQRYLGMDFDASADSAARLWDSRADDHERVWTAQYADDHDVETYPDTRGLAPADVREADARDYPHDEPCPRCGRRQWTAENAPETCTACGYDLQESDFQ
jgi:hypothetical protein